MSEDDYDNLRKKNIAERNAFFAEFFKDLKNQTNEIKELNSKLVENIENEPPKKRRRTVSTTEGKDKGYKVKNEHVEFRRKYNTRSSLKNTKKDGQNESKRKGPRLKVLFPWAKPFQRSLDLMKMGVCDVDQEEENELINSDKSSGDDDCDYDDDYDSDDEDYMYGRKTKTIYKVTKAPYDPNTIPSVDEITEEMLDNIAEKSSNKDYCKISGTSCHQCRQKTLDTKTVCRSGECIGVRGQFCGPCLKGRYGESAYEALKNPNWACPPCRGLCNCSICRTRSGLRPTGILAPTAQEEGFTSVMDYLKSTENDDT